MEVYMPNKKLDIDGFFDPTNDDSHFKRKIDLKLSDKFGDKGLIGLNGKVILGVNIIFFDSIYIQTQIKNLEHDFLFDNIGIRMPVGVDGILFFEDDFQGSNSFKLHKIICNK